MNSRLSLIGRAIKSVAGACNPVLRWYSVSYFGVGHKWVTEETLAYSDMDAAAVFGKKAGYDCFVRRIFK